MQVLISAEGEHIGPDGVRIPHVMVVDHHLVMLDLSGVHGTLVDPTILRVTWDKQLDGTVIRDGGTIVRRDGRRQLFWDSAVLKPYLDAYAARKAELSVSPA